jgi:hypothetical protein
MNCKEYAKITDDAHALCCLCCTVRSLSNCFAPNRASGRRGSWIRGTTARTVRQARVATGDGIDGGAGAREERRWSAVHRGKLDSAPVTASTEGPGLGRRGDGAQSNVVRQARMGVDNDIDGGGRVIDKDGDGFQSRRYRDYKPVPERLMLNLYSHLLPVTGSVCYPNPLPRVYGTRGHSHIINIY